MPARDAIDVELLATPLDLQGHTQELTQLCGVTSTSVDLNAELNRPHSRVWIAFTPASRAQAYLLAWTVADELQIIDLATLPQARRQGFGRALLEALFSYGGECGFGSVQLEVRADNLAAIQLYREFGFETQRVRPGYYGDGQAAWEMGARL